MKLAIAIAMMLVAYTNQACTKGCLVCDKSGACLLCDFTKLYILQQGNCATVTVSNCDMIGFTGACASCKTGFYFDSTTSACLTVSNTTAVANCATYSSGQACLGCAPGYYINQGNCLAVNITVANCDYYSANGVCSVCKAGFLWSNDLTSCVAPTAITNCATYTYIKC
jgi:hypothetical protein